MADLPNRLAGEVSPYLQQHAHNPVDWYPWGEEALARARDEARPLLVSIGYSACHWCHVMERESFEDAETAALMNAHFVNVKVDREERPDVDRIYQTVCQVVNRSGGWPLTVFLTPERKPFYVGTYFPPEPRYGHPGFRDVLRAVAEAWEKRHDDVLRVADQWAEALAEAERPPLTPGREVPGPEALTAAARALAGGFDRVNGGFGQAPKFPHPTELGLLLRAGGEYRDLACQALRAMAAGGIYDQLGGGFHRYSVDARWEVPHFEKMLYDNALLAPLYLDAWRLTGDPALLAIAHETADFMLRELRSPEGGFYGTLDADSEGEEGRFYTWTGAQVEAAAGAQAARALAEGQGLGEEPTTLRGGARPWRRELLAARESRVRPGRDEKVLTGWNGLAIGALARLGGGYADAARRAADWLLATMVRPGPEGGMGSGTGGGTGDGTEGGTGDGTGDGTGNGTGDGTGSGPRGGTGRGLWRRWKDGQAAIAGTLEDYAYLTAGLIDLWEASFAPLYLETAVGLAREACARFWVEGEGLYLVEPSDELIIRPQEVLDGPTPGPAAALVDCLLRLAPLAGEEVGAGFEQVARAALQLYGELLRQPQWGASTLICALDRAAAGNTEVLIVAGEDDPLAREWLERLQGIYLPSRVLARVDPAAGPPWPAPLWEGRSQRGGSATAYVCRGRTCSLPVHAWADIASLLE